MFGYSYEDFIEQINSDNEEELQLDCNRIASALGLGRKVHLTYVCPIDSVASDILPKNKGADRIKDLRMVSRYAKADLWKLDNIKVVDAVFDNDEYLWFASEEDADEYEVI